MESFHWTATWDVLVPKLFETGWKLDAAQRSFTRDDQRVYPPLVFPVVEGARSLTDYLRHLPDQPARHTAILMQAGAVSLGLFEGGEPIATRSFRRYVVRGTGRAQPTHLKTKGKSRYGSRLRLQNAKLLLEETNEKLIEWAAEFGASDCIYYNAPVRLWPTLFEARPSPPFAKGDRMIKIPRDLPKPTTEILLRAYRGLCFGRIEQL